MEDSSKEFSLISKGRRQYQRLLALRVYQYFLAATVNHLFRKNVFVDSQQQHRVVAA